MGSEVRSHVWQTSSDQGHAARLAYWTDLVGETLFGASIDPLNVESFSGRLEALAHGETTLLRALVSPQILERTSQAVARDGCDDVVLNLILGGRLRVRQGGREILIGAGDCFLSDCADRFDYHAPDTLQALSLKLPRATVLRYLPAIESVIGQRINGQNPWGRALGSYLLALAENDRPEMLPNSMLIEQVICIIRVALEPATASPSSHQAATLGRARAVLRERWTEETLSPLAVAETVGVSRSHLHALFAKAGTTFGRELETIRIEHAAALLGPVGRRLTVSEIAYRCGFASAAHFSRKFRMVRGASPSDYRREALG